MKAVIVIIAGLVLMDAITLLLLKREVRKRHEAEERAEVAKRNIEILTAAHNIKQDARDEADKKIFSIRGMPRRVGGGGTLLCGVAVAPQLLCHYDKGAYAVAAGMGHPHRWEWVCRYTCDVYTDTVRIGAATQLYRGSRIVRGGEPTLLSDWAAAKIIKRLEYYPRFFLLTNGTLPRSLWYLADNCYTLTHVTDWAKTMKAKSAGERDWVKIVVTRGDIDKLGAFLDKNGCERLEVSPSMGGGEEADLTAAECLRVSAIMQKHGMDALRIQGGPMMDINGLDDEQLASITACDGQNTEWAVDCSFDTEAVAAPCCMCFADAVPLSKFTGREKPSCKNCIGRMV